MDTGNAAQSSRIIISGEGGAHYFQPNRRHSNIPRSTALQWIRGGVKEVVMHPSLGKSCDALTEENAALQKKCSAEKARIELLNVSLRVTGFQMQDMRVAAGELKSKLLGGITTATSFIRPEHWGH